MQTLPFLSIVFIAISVIFLAFSFIDYLKAEGKMTIARKVWLRLALIFSAVGIGLLFFQKFLY
jgi:hypothetical protein